MITKITKDNRALYENVLFKRALKACYPDKTEEEIAELAAGLDIHGYFAILKQAASADKAVLMLPFDEPTFDIDADSRQIAIPQSFRNNGLSVKGDNLAETIYFSIDRYFDAMDLYDRDVQFIIQWETQSGGKVIDTGISMIPRGIKDDHSDDFVDAQFAFKNNKLLFGWPISNHITEQAGSVRFAVRFYKIVNDQMIFSLSTLPASINVNSSLDFQYEGKQWDTYVWEDAKNLELRFTKDMGWVPDTGEMSDPEFVWTLDQLYASKYIKTVEEEGKTVHYIDLDKIGETPDGEDVFELKLGVVAQGDGVIVYDWSEKSLDGEPFSPALEQVEFYFITKDVEFLEGKTYFRRELAEGIESFVEIPAEDAVGPIADFGEDVYEFAQKAAIVANRTGNYMCTVSNRNGLRPNIKASVDTDIIRVPGPEALSVEVPAGLLMKDDKYQVRLDEDGLAELSAQGTTEQDKDIIVYTWVDEDATTPDVIHKKTDMSIDTFVIPVVEEADRAMYDETFTVRVIATRNGDETESVAKSFRVTAPAAEPVVAPLKTNYYHSVDEPAHLELTVSMNGHLSDELTYQWYQYTNSTEDDDILLEGETAETCDVLGTGVFYCKVTNHVNGSSATNDPSTIEDPVERVSKMISVNVI